MSIRSLRPNETAAHAAAPQQPLPVLPLFMDVRDQSVLIAGNSDAVRWKAELLARAGAIVHLYTGQGASDLWHGRPGRAFSRRIMVHHRIWTADDMAGRRLAICDARDDREAERFAAAARCEGVLCNVIDRAQYCDMQFGSIVQRGPVVIGISTSGTMPVLAQKIRMLIESRLPANLGHWAQRAGQWRRDVATRLSGGENRRAFWRGVADIALSGRAVDDGAIRQQLDRSACQQINAAGRVTLVGAGPGDAELLTLKAVRALQAADVILYDNLVSPDVLDLARREARKISVGKRGGQPSCSQAKIIRLMLTYARQGLHVVRLKGGDPMIFGRAGEELAQLQQSGIGVQVVPGVTTALAMASSLGVSLTHRDMAQSVQFVTAHRQDGKLPDDLDWASLADARSTKVFYMGGRNAARVADHLQACGMPADTPAVICKSVARPGQMNWFGTLGQLADGMMETGWDEPVIIGIGQVFADADAGARTGDVPVVSQQGQFQLSA